MEILIMIDKMMIFLYIVVVCTELVILWKLLC